MTTTTILPNVNPKTMKKYGYTFTHTGGGCTAYEKRYGSGRVMITDNASAPTHLKQIVQVGLYDKQDETMGFIDLIPLDTFLEHEKKLLKMLTDKHKSKAKVLALFSGEANQLYNEKGLKALQKNPNLEGQWKIKTFDTVAEARAYRQGVEDSNGWLDPQTEDYTE